MAFIGTPFMILHNSNSWTIKLEYSIYHFYCTLTVTDAHSRGVLQLVLQTKSIVRCTHTLAATEISGISERPASGLSKLKCKGRHASYRSAYFACLADALVST
jgi:hypothetical protein